MIRTIIGVREELLTKKLLFLVGFTRAGKFLLGKVCGGLQGVDHFQYISAVESLPLLVRLGLIDRKSAVALMRALVDEHAYYMRIGRNLNTRASDRSSILHLFDKQKYLDRAAGPDGLPAALGLARGDMYSVFICHEMMPNIDVALEGFPDAKFMDIKRHPVDLVYSWWKRNMGNRETNDPLSFAPYFRCDGLDTPWYAASWGPEYVKISPIDRIIRSIDYLEELSRTTFRLLSQMQQEQFLVLTHEGLLEDSWSAVERMEKFLGVERREFMPVLLAREGAFKPQDHAKRQVRMEAIAREASPENVRRLEEMTRCYQENFNDPRRMYYDD